MKKFLLIAALVFSQFASADEEVVSGHWFEDDYAFYMSTDWEDVSGSWGMSRYSLYWDSFNNLLQGTTAGVRQELEFDNFSKTISGESYCGWIDLQYTESSLVHLKGNFCLAPVDMIFASKAEMLEWIKKDILVKMVEEFPEPAREPVHNFLKRIINPYQEL